jgi:hypothetical protein
MQLVEAGTPVAPLRSRNTFISKLCCDVPSLSLCDGTQLAALVLHGLIVRADAQIKSYSHVASAWFDAGARALFKNLRQIGTI